MTYLSSNQLHQYEDEGFVSPINIFSKDKAKEIRNEIETIDYDDDLSVVVVRTKKHTNYEIKLKKQIRTRGYNFQF